MRILGLDASLNTGYIDIDIVRGSPLNIVHRGVITAPVQNGMDRFVRYSQIATKLLDIIEHTKFAGVFIEGYSFNSKFNGVTMGEIGGILRYFLWQNDSAQVIIEVPPTSLKTFVTGRGTAKKEVMMLEVYKRWSFSPKNNDEADAYGLAMFGAVWLGIQMDLPKKNLGAVEAVKKEYQALKK